MSSTMQNHKRNPEARSLRSLRCPRCRKLLARLEQGPDSVIEIRCPRCKALVFADQAGTFFAEGGLTATAH